MSKIVNNDTFTLGDVKLVTGGFPNTLSECFTGSVAADFDPRYAKSGQWLHEFRNYGNSASLTYKDAEDIDSFVYRWDYRDGSDYFYWISAQDETLNAWAISSLGVLSENAAVSTSAYHPLSDIHCVGDDEFIVLEYYAWRITARYWQYSAGSIGEYDDNEYTGSYLSDPPTMSAIDEDNNQFIFFAESWATDNTGKIHVLNYATGSKTLAFKTPTTLGYGLNGMHYQNGYLHVLCDSGSNTLLRSYSVNSSTGVLTYNSSITITSVSIYGITGNGDDLIFLNRGSAHYCFSVSSGAYTLEDTDTISPGSGVSVDYDPVSNAVFFIDTYYSHDNLYAKRVDTSLDFVTEATFNWGAYSVGTGTYILVLSDLGFVLVCTSGTEKIISAEIG